MIICDLSAIVSEHVEIGDASFVGANATVIQGKRVGNHCIIGAGTAVRKNMEDNCMAWNRERTVLGGGYKLTSQKGCAA